MSKRLRIAAQPKGAPHPLDDLTLAEAFQRIEAMSVVDLRHLWRETHGRPAPEALTKDLMARLLAYRLQEQRLGGLSPALGKQLVALARGGKKKPARRLRVGTVLVREHDGVLHEVFVMPEGYCWRGEVFSSLSIVARRITGVSWSGPRFFGLKESGEAEPVDKTAMSDNPPSPAEKKRRGRPPRASVLSRAEAHTS